MFTGIVEEIGQIAAIRKGSASAVLSIQASKVLEGTKIGDSIAVNGICLTVTGMQERSFTADVMAETLRRSSPMADLADTLCPVILMGPERSYQCNEKTMLCGSKWKHRHSCCVILSRRVLLLLMGSV